MSVPGRYNRSRTRHLSPISSDSSSEDEPLPVKTSFTSSQPSTSDPNDFDEHEDGEVSEDDSEVDEFNDGYDEELMGDWADREKMARMTEREREQVIFERSERREKLKARFEIEKKLKQTKKLTSTLGDEAKNRSLNRKRIIEGKHDPKTAAMDELVAQREDRRLRAEEKEKKRLEQQEGQNLLLLLKKDGSENRQKLVVNQVYSSSESEESDLESNIVPPNQIKLKQPQDVKVNIKFPSVVRKPIEPPRDSDSFYASNAKQLSRIQMTRSTATKWVHFPFFNALISGCFVKITVEGNRGVGTAHIREVSEVVDGPSYELLDTCTTKYARLTHVLNKQTDFKMSLFSNQPFTNDDYMGWETEMKELNAQVPSIEHIKAKEREFHDARNYQLNDEDISLMIKEKKKLNMGRVNHALEKTILLKERTYALLSGDRDRIQELDSEIRALDEKSKEQDKGRTNNLAKVSVINERNRRRNREIMETAILESQEQKDVDGKNAEDPFVRRNTKPSRPASKKEKFEDVEASPIPVFKIDDVEMKAVDEAPALLIRDEAAMTEVPILDISMDVDEPPQKGWFAVSNDGERYQVPLDQYPHLRNMTFYDKGYMEDMFMLHDFEIKGLDEDCMAIDRKDCSKPAHNFPLRPPVNPHAALFSLSAVVVPIPTKRKISLQEYKLRHGMF